MTDKPNRSAPPDQGASPSVDGFVLVAMALVVAAIVVGLHLQFGLPLGAAGLVGLSLFLGLTGFQAYQHGVEQRERLAREVERLRAESIRLERSSPASPRRGAMVARRAALRDAGSGADLAEAEVTLRPTLTEGLAPETAGPETAGADQAAISSAVAADVEPAVDPVPAAPQNTASAAIREDDVELLQRRIKEMLSQVTAAEQAREAEVQTGANGPAEADEVPAAALGLEASLHALRTAAQTMRAPSTPAVTAPPLPASIPPEALPSPEGDTAAQVASLTEAIAAGRVDVFLEPILGLSDQAAQHYEVSIRVRGPMGEDLGTGSEADISGRGLLPLFDTARLARTAIVAQRLSDRGKTGSVFSHASGESLLDQDFASGLNQDFGSRRHLARQLVLTFSQSDIRSFRAAEQRAVAALGGLGFRFAISGLTDLDMNFEAMARAGFAFVKLDAAVFTEGLPHPGGTIPATDVCRHLADQGFGVIVEGIDSEEMLARIFGFGVLLGQGALFGGRRPVKAQVAAKPGQAAA